MSLIHHRLVNAYRLIEDNRITHTETGWLVKGFSGHDYEVTYSWRQFVKHKNGFGCNCRDHLMRGFIECQHIKAVKIYIEQNKGIKV